MTGGSRVEIRPLTFRGKLVMWGVVDTMDDLVLFGAVGRGEAEGLVEMCALPGELESARRNALSHAHEHVDGGIVRDERYAGRLPASGLEAVEKSPVPGRPVPPMDGLVA